MRIILKIGSFFLPLFIEYYSRISVFFTGKSAQKKTISVINTQDQGGGAAKIAHCLIENSEFKNEIQFFVNQKKRIDERIQLIPKPSTSRFQRWIDEMENRGGWLDISKISPLDLLKNNFFRSSKIVHLHNIHGDYFSYAILPALMKNKRVIWTLHDEQLITGHCSCTLGCEKWKTGCGNCPHLSTYPAVKIDNTKKLLAYKTKWLRKMNPIIVCPSNWLANRVNIAFPFLNDVCVIENGVDTNLFKPALNKTELREKLNLPVDAFLILFAAELSTNNPFKGGELVNEIIKDGLEEHIYIVTVGGETDKNSNQHISFDYVQDENQMAELYAASDVLIYPTQADNLPLVVLEAMSSGLPVIASNIGGISEIIEDHVDGYLVHAYTEKEEYKKILAKIRMNTTHETATISTNARQKIISRFSLKTMVDQYDKLYKEQLSDTKL